MVNKPCHWLAGFAYILLAINRVCLPFVNQWQGLFTLSLVQGFYMSEGLVYLEYWTYAYVQYSNLNNQLCRSLNLDFYFDIVFSECCEISIRIVLHWVEFGLWLQSSDCLSWTHLIVTCSVAAFLVMIPASNRPFVTDSSCILFGMSGGAFILIGFAFDN